MSSVGYSRLRSAICKQACMALAGTRVCGRSCKRPYRDRFIELMRAFDFDACAFDLDTLGCIAFGEVPLARHSSNKFGSALAYPAPSAICKQACMALAGTRVRSAAFGGQRATSPPAMPAGSYIISAELHPTSEKAVNTGFCRCSRNGWEILCVLLRFQGVFSVEFFHLNFT